MLNNILLRLLGILNMAVDGPTIQCKVRGRSQLSTFMKAYTAYARGRGSRTYLEISPNEL